MLPVHPRQPADVRGRPGTVLLRARHPAEQAGPAGGLPRDPPAVPALLPHVGRHHLLVRLRRHGRRGARLRPHFGSLSRSILYGYGYCGNGIAATHTGGKVLRDLVLGKDSEYSRLLFVDDERRKQPPAFPPEPLLFVGARAVSRLMEWKESRA
ncbi:hypothetical protein NKH77_53825 [Streptomyces sp. M19]